LADYRDNYQRIQAAGAGVIAVSVDTPEQADPMRRELHLPFPILCDTERRVLRDWDIYNPREHKGIPVPSVFLIDRDRTVRYVSIDGIAMRIPASEIAQLLESGSNAVPVRRKLQVPTPADFFRGVRNSIRGKTGTSS
jgi:peroxiredoxin